MNSDVSCVNRFKNQANQWILKNVLLVLSKKCCSYSSEMVTAWISYLQHLIESFNSHGRFYNTVKSAKSNLVLEGKFRSSALSSECSSYAGRQEHRARFFYCKWHGLLELSEWLIAIIWVILPKKYAFKCEGVWVGRILL